MRIPPLASLPAAFLLLLAAPAPAQGPGGGLPPGVEDLPIGFGPGEAPVTPGSVRSRATAPPLGPVRAAAEWDESRGVFCIWNNDSLLQELASDNTLYVTTTNSSWWTSYLGGLGISMSNVDFLSASTNTFWVRDYGPWFLWDVNDQFGLVDTVYNRPRPSDDVIPGAIASGYGVPYYATNLIHTGGNYYADGRGRGLSTTLVYSENPGLSEAQVDQAMEDYLGVVDYVTPRIPYSIQHMDTFGKTLAPDTILWGSFPSGTTPWAWSEAAYKQLSTLQSPYGWPYKLPRIPLYSQSGSWTAYVNCLMTNRKIVMPAYGTANDAAAEAIIEAAAPGYDVVRVSALGTDWGDSVHCRTRNFVRGEAVRIYPHPHWERAADTLVGYPVSAEVISDPATALSGNPVVYWTTTGGAPFGALPLLPTGAPGMYAATLPAQAPGTTIGYYYHAEDLLGRTKDAPFVAPQGLFTIAVAADTEGPEFEHAALHGVTLAAWPPEVSCVAIDAFGVPSVALEYAVNGTPQPPQALVKEDGTFRFTASLAGTVWLGDVVSYRLVATDAATPANSTAAPVSGWHSFEIGATKPIAVVELDPTPDSGQRWVDACDDLGLQAELVTSFPQTPSAYEALVVCLGMDPTEATLTSSQANALVSFMSAGGSVYLEGGDAFAQASTASIYRSWFGLSSAGSGGTVAPPLTGVAGTETSGMSFGHQGEAAGSDDLNLLAAAEALLMETSYVKACAYTTGTYDAVASSLQFGGLVEGSPPSHAKRLAAGYLRHLGFDVDLVISRSASDPTRGLLSLEGDPGATFTIWFSEAPGHYPLGPPGLFRLDQPTMRFLRSGTLDPLGHYELPLNIPQLPSYEGVEIYVQAFVEQPVGSGVFVLSNRDRIVLGAQ